MKKSSLLALACLALATGCTQIDTGDVGVQRSFGKVNPTELPQGMHITWFSSVDEYTIKEVPLVITDLKPKSRDNLTMADVDLDIYYKVRPDKMAELYMKYQGDVGRVLKPQQDGKLLDTGDEIVGMGRVLREARESVYRAIARFDATTMHLKRDEIASTVKEILQKDLNATDPDTFEITNVNVRNLVTDAALEASIRKRAELDQQIEAKEKENQMALKEAARLLTEANGQAAANHVINASITDKLLKMKEIEAMQAIAAKNGNTTIMVPHGAQTLLNISK